MSSWIKVRTIIGTDPAIAQLASRLRMEPAHVIGCFVLLWSWADGLTENGEIKNASRDLIDKIAEKKGFAKEAEKVGWLEVRRTSVVFPKWDRHNSCSAKARAGEATRKAEQRRAKKTEGQSSGQMSGHSSGQSSGPEERRGEERRIEDTLPPTPKPGEREISAAPADSDTFVTAAEREAHRALPTELESIEGFRDHWEQWVLYLCDRHKRMPPQQTFDAHLRSLLHIATEHGSAAALGAITRAVSLGYAAPCEPKKTSGGAGGAGAAQSTFTSPLSPETVAAGYAFTAETARNFTPIVPIAAQ